MVLTRSDVNKGHPAYYQDYATRLAKELPGAFYIDQFNNKANPLAHSTTTARACSNSSKDTLMRLWLASVRVERWADSRPGLLNIRRILNSCWPIPQVQYWPIRSNPDGLRKQAPGWLRVSAKTFLRALSEGVQRAYRIRRPGGVYHRSRPAENRRHSCRILQRYAACRRPALLPGANHAKTRGDLRL